MQFHNINDEDFTFPIIYGHIICENVNKINK